MNTSPGHIDFFESMSASDQFDSEFALEDRHWRKAKEDFDDLFMNRITERTEPGIPKRIFQIWLGSPLPEKYKRWASTWRDFHPEWEYQLWTDQEAESLDMQNREIYKSTKNLGSKSDILRYEILNKYGGLYVDTDFECFKPFDYLHFHADFYAGIAFGKELTILNGIIGAIPGHPIITDLLRSISAPVETNEGDEIHNVTGPWAFSRTCKSHMFSNNHRNVLLPVTYFYPFPNDKLHVHSERRIQKYRRKESMALHYWEVSWLIGESYFDRIKTKILRYIPKNIKIKIKRLLGI